MIDIVLFLFFMNFKELRKYNIWFFKCNFINIYKILVYKYIKIFFKEYFVVYRFGYNIYYIVNFLCIFVFVF